MIDVNLNTIEKQLNSGLITISMVHPMTKKSHFRLSEGVSVTLSNYDVIDIPKGFLFDGSSSPRFLWWLFPSYGDFFFASIIHDYMYKIRYMESDVGQRTAQKIADEEMLKWSNLINDRNMFKLLDNKLRYYAVRLFGKKLFIT